MEVQSGVTAELRFPEEGGDAVTLSEPTVTVVRDSDGSTLVDAKEAQESEDKEFFTFDLKGSDIPEPDLLHVTWQDDDSTFKQEVEVVGGFVCSIAEVREVLKQDAEDKNYPTDAKVRRERERATRDIEAAVWDAFRPRYHKDVLSGDNSNVILLTRRRVQKILSLSIDGVALTESELKDLALTNVGLERDSREFPHGFTAGRNNIVVSYIYGHDNFPECVEPVKALAVFRLIPAPNNLHDRATGAFETETGTSYKLVTAGEKGARFSVPAVNAFVEANSVARFV